MSERRVLVVDDDAHIRTVLHEAFTDMGYEVRQAGNGQAALEELARWTPTAIILDLMMPAMDGRQFRQRQRALAGSGDIPVVLLSASRRIEEADDLGAAVIMAKPFDLNRLIDLVDALHSPPA